MAIVAQRTPQEAVFEDRLTGLAESGRIVLVGPDHHGRDGLVTPKMKVLTMMFAQAPGRGIRACNQAAICRRAGSKAARQFSSTAYYRVSRPRGCHERCFAMSRNWKVVVDQFPGRIEGLTLLEALMLANAIKALTGRKAEAVLDRQQE